jgi:copper chaperone CopZ
MMRRQGVPIVSLGCLLAVGLAITATEAAAPNTVTTMTIKMGNETCAKRIATSLREVPNVGDVRSDVVKRTATVTPAGLRSPSPRTLWEAVEKTGHTVVQLQGPLGTFTTRPAN